MKHKGSGSGWWWREQRVEEERRLDLGGGGRILFSLENFPRESWFSSVIGGYFIAYCICDLLIGQLHYREHIDPASGWMHHLVYSGLVYVLATQHSLSSFLIAGGLLEGMSFIFSEIRKA